MMNTEIKKTEENGVYAAVCDEEGDRIEGRKRDYYPSRLKRSFFCHLFVCSNF